MIGRCSSTCAVTGSHEARLLVLRGMQGRAGEAPALSELKLYWGKDDQLTSSLDVRREGVSATEVQPWRGLLGGLSQGWVKRDRWC